MSEKDSTPAYYFDPDQAKAEANCLDQRLNSSVQPEQTPEQRISSSLGLALSGGGIRSATFNLGLLQALAARKKLKDFDYLSTVSGGSYIGSFLGRLFHRAQEENPANTSPLALADDVERKLASDEAPIIRWMRDNGRYLAPHGTRDRLFAAAIYLRNMLSVHIFLGVILLSAFALLACLRAWFGPSSSTDYSPGPAWNLVVVLIIGFLASTWAYWMIRRDQGLAWVQVTIALGLGAVALLLLGSSSVGLPPPYSMLTWWHNYALLLVAAITLLALLVALRVRSSSTTLAHARNRLSKNMSYLLTAVLMISSLALLDDLALVGMHRFKDHAEWSLVGACGIIVLLGLRVLAERLSAVVGKLGSDKGGLVLKGLIGMAGVLLLLLVVFGWGVTTYTVTKNHLANPLLRGALTAASIIIMLVLLCYRGNRNLDFLNLSSLHQFYAARLTRAYLGAGNKRRRIAWTEKPMRSRDQRPVSDVVKGDDLPLWVVSGANQDNVYAPHRRGGPLHLINVNVNQTRYSSTGNFQPDRKGWNLAVGPTGLNLGRTYWQRTPWHDAEALSLGCWVSISGAAISTGAGPRTSLGFSALLGLLGVRLGYWWHAGKEDHHKCTPTIAGALLAEITGSFNPDHHSHWYLSDGGHFENTAAYELIRRRLKRIVIADCGADLEYGFEDIANLVQKARIDFDTEIEFFSDWDLDRLWGVAPWRCCFFAPRLGLPKTGDAPLALARVRYPNDAVYGWLLVVKPRLPQKLPADLARYASIAPDYPQQSTADQFYDEAQWESTRKLGRILGDQLVDSLVALNNEAWAAYLTSKSSFEGAKWNDRRD